MHLRLWPLGCTLALLPLLAIALAYGLNLQAGTATPCNPFLSGCVSISRAVRVEPGLPWFRLLMTPAAALLVLFWTLVRRQLLPRQPHTRAVLFSGLTGALFLLLYISFMATTGDFYQWLRRTGIIFFFAGTGLAQLLLAHALQVDTAMATRQCRRQLLVLCAAMILLGLLNTIIMYGLHAPDKWENIGEWWLGVLLCLGFASIARWQYRRQD
ncbi:MAG TPA: hypothetical protein DF427_05890 [Moraxellaceae bacterium]|nr:hypothetical protein [Moraxellaceae bacterium]